MLVQDAGQAGIPGVAHALAGIVVAEDEVLVAAVGVLFLTEPAVVRCRALGGPWTAVIVRLWRGAPCYPA